MEFFKLFNYFYQTSCAAVVFVCALSGASMQKLILISMDGFQFDYLDLVAPNEAKHFQFMIRNGVKAKSIMNVFPTNTYPNHYTLITGLYPESHGMVDNKFYDAVWNEYFDFDNRRDNVDPFWYDTGAEPIYVTNKKADPLRNSGSVVWPAGIGKVKGIGPDRVIPYADSWSRINNTERVDTIISWFTDKTVPINLGLLYFLEPDGIGHVTGGGSKNVTDMIKVELDNVLGYLFKKLKENGLLDEMNIILTSDHGFANYSRDKAVLLSDHLNTSWYKTGSVQFGNYALHKHIFPEEGLEENVLQALRNIPYLKVYRKGGSELERLHYNSSTRIAPIVITGSEEGVVIFPDEASRDRMKSVGVHGYDPYLVPSMRPFFLAIGPAFKKGYVSEQFNSVDIYPLMCHILGIVPAPNNGSFENVECLLREKSVMSKTHERSTTVILLVIFAGLCALLAGIYSVCTCQKARKQLRLGNKTGPEVTTTGSATDSAEVERHDEL
ncbi:ectonucleotide pyrophosphatase/phosphodiesterase family member 5-like [Mercenaria mercenaria]|uniref:ectonucleotide pyrophosphatase/phosphodiesterase family member 5-like n=1 Tax=Mercenaria mercenaria TaxID=6596 RepID=UPI00234EC27E|nr:ectonucleotide pyrophosphatase/phosphodiesterase family member 5-like [Mercenaria mercenaria]